MTSEPAAPDTSAHDSYDPRYFEPLFAAEDQHFWFQGRNAAIAAVTAQVAAALSSGYAVLEVGCGNGNVLRVLEETCRRGTVAGMDLFPDGLRNARRRTSCPLVQGDLHHPPFRAKFDIIGIFDVLEHLTDEAVVLHDLREMLTDRGTLLITVPAHASLWSYFDEAGHHCRRYEVAELQEKLAGAGFVVEYVTQFMTTIFPLVWLWRRLANRRRDEPRRIHDLAAQELRLVPGVNPFLTYCLRQEARLLARRRHLPAGTSLLAVARKCG
jgi:SAM-dependent methyltransferase